MTDRPGLEATQAETEINKFPLLPYDYVYGQEELRTVLEVAFVMGTERSGVLVSGERGTAKSTIARSFAHMMYGGLPVNLPINATDDRVIGGWDINSLMAGDLKPLWRDGLLRQAADEGMLYIDEVNLLEDHIINLILDPVSTGVLNPQRDGQDGEDPAKNKDVSFMLVGTMNPDEGPLRPQLLDRFAFYVPIKSQRGHEARKQILKNVLRFDRERRRPDSQWLSDGAQRDGELKTKLEGAQALFKEREGEHSDGPIIDICAQVAAAFNVVGHRAEIVMARAAYAFAARDCMISEDRSSAEPTSADVAKIAKYAIMHRRSGAASTGLYDWDDQSDSATLDAVIAGVVGSEPR